MKYQFIQKEEIDNFIIDNIGNLNNQEKHFIKNIIGLIYYFTNIIFLGKTYGDFLSNIEPDSKKIFLILSYLLNLISKYYINKSSIMKLIYKFCDFLSYLNFIGNNNNNQMITPNYFPLNYLFNIKYKNTLNIKDNNLLYKENMSFFTRNLLYNEFSDLIIMLLPKRIKTFKYSLLDKEYISNLCSICRNECTNTIKLLCGHKYCYYCYIINKKKKLNYCLICNK